MPAARSAHALSADNGTALDSSRGRHPEAAQCHFLQNRPPTAFRKGFVLYGLSG